MSQTSDILHYLQPSPQSNFFLFAGPCVVESQQMALDIAGYISELCQCMNIPYVFKGSYRKANRSRIDSFTGIGDIKALEILARVKQSFNIPVVTDIHTPDEAVIAAQYVDILQIPAFLCRQTDLLCAAARTGKMINIKKGQFMSPQAMQFAIDKVKASGNNMVAVTERGSMFGYNDLIVDFRSIPTFRKMGVPAVVDVTHSLQQPNLTCGVTGGNPDMISTIARAAVAVGADGIFIETHPDPASAKSDGANMLPLDQLKPLLELLCSIRLAITAYPPKCALI